MSINLETLKQPSNREPSKGYQLQPELNRRLLDWAGTLPNSPNGIIDFASGRGTEVALLRNAGYSCMGTELSKLAVQQAVIPGSVKLGDITNLQERSNVYGGVILVDGLVWFSPLQRRQLLKEAHRLLVPSGKMFVRNESTPMDHVLISDGETTTDYKRAEGIPDHNWREYVQNQIQAGGKVVAVVWKCELDAIIEQATKVGFEVEDIETFSSDSPLAQENRWDQSDGFILKLRKKQ